MWSQLRAEKKANKQTTNNAIPGDCNELQKKTVTCVCERVCVDENDTFVRDR